MNWGVEMGCRNWGQYPQYLETGVLDKIYGIQPKFGAEPRFLAP